MEDNIANLFDEEEASTLTIADWVSDKLQLWRDHHDSKYKPRFDEYYRIWRGQWAEEDSTRKSERSRLVSPGSMQAVEEGAAEVLDASLSGDLFDIRDDVADQNELDIQVLREKLKEDISSAKVDYALGEMITNGAVYGTGCGEIVAEVVKEQKPAARPALGGSVVQIGVEITERTVFKLRSILPQNFLPDPNATSVDNGLGVIIDEFVGKEQVEMLQESGIYDDTVDVGTAPSESSLEPTQDGIIYENDRVRLTRYFGLVPRVLLEKEPDEDVEELVEREKDDSLYVEAIIVIGNGKLLKATANPYMMGDRPLISFPWDVVPGEFHGRGVIEKAYNSQKAVDAEIRARIDALALTNHPMLASDTTRMPRGAKPQVRPGAHIKTNGDPREILMPFNFGQVSQITFAQAESLQRMLQQATGSMDAANMPNAAAGGGAKTGAVAMALGTVAKRSKRTLLNFQTCALIPLINKLAWRYMQFDPENYPVGDYKFHVDGSIGMVAREYEVAQLAQLLSTMPPDSPLYPVLLESIVDNMALSNREEVVAKLKEASKPNEEKLAMEKQAHEADMEIKRTTIASLEGQAMEANSHGALYQAQAQNIPMENKIDLANIASKNRSPDDGTGDKEFEQRLKILDALRKDRELSIKEKSVKQAEQSESAEKAAMEKLLNG